jgi:NADH dehydrogenase FAD-containing subunit
MPIRVVILGAGFGGLELTPILSETFVNTMVYFRCD